MSTLEKTLRDLAAAGELTYISVVPVAGPGGIVFAAMYSPASRWGHGMGRDADPVAAIMAAIADYPAKRTHGVRGGEGRIGGTSREIVSDEDLLS